MEISIEDDNNIEDVESFFVFLTSPGGDVQIASDTAVVRIADNSGKFCLQKVC